MVGADFAYLVQREVIRSRVVFSARALDSATAGHDGVSPRGGRLAHRASTCGFTNGDKASAVIIAMPGNFMRAFSDALAPPEIGRRRKIDRSTFNRGGAYVRSCRSVRSDDGAVEPTVGAAVYRFCRGSGRR